MAEPAFTTITTPVCDSAAIIDAVERLGEAQSFTIEADGQVLEKLVLPRGMQVVDVQSELDKRAPKPLRATGSISVDTLDAFIALTARHACPSTVVYVHNADQPSLVAVINDTAKLSTPGWRDFRVVYSPKLSDEWKAWKSADGKSLSQVEFAALLEDRCLDVVPPSSVGPKTKGIIEQLGVRAATPADLQGLARGLSIKVDLAVKEIRRLDSGEAQVVYSEEHRGDDGKPLSVPNAFVIAIPVFIGGAAYSHVVRLRYRAVGGRITWAYGVVHADTARRDAVLDMAAKLRDALPEVLTIEGTP